MSSREECDYLQESPFLRKPTTLGLSFTNNMICVTKEMSKENGSTTGSLCLISPAYVALFTSMFF